MSENNSKVLLNTNAAWLPRYFFPLFKTIDGNLSLTDRSFIFTDVSGNVRMELPLDNVKKFLRRGARGGGSVWVIIPTQKQKGRLAFLVHTPLDRGPSPSFKEWNEAFRQQL